MTQRERGMLLVAGTIGGFLVLFVGFILVTKALSSLSDKDSQIAAIQREVDLDDVRSLNLVKTQAKYDYWKAISLPPDLKVANDQYKLFLTELARKHGLLMKSPITAGTGQTHAGSASARPSKFNPVLTYAMHVEATLPKLIGFLHDFYAINLPHAVRDMKLTRPTGDSEGKLVVTLSIEALSLPNAANKEFLVALPGFPLLAVDVFTAMKGGPAGLAIGPWLATPTGAHGARKLASRVVAQRDYTRLVSKNVFLGLQPPTAAVVDAVPAADKDVLKHVQLTSITSNFLATEATLYSRMTGKYHTVRAEGGFDGLEIRDGNNQVVLKATVKAITPQDLVFLVGDKHYAIHIGTSVEQALRKALTAAELKDFGVTTAAVGEAAALEKE